MHTRIYSLDHAVEIATLTGDPYIVYVPKRGTYHPVPTKRLARQVEFIWDAKVVWTQKGVAR